MEDGDDDDVGEAQRHRDLHEHGGDAQARALLGVSTEFRESFTIFEYNIVTEKVKSRNFDDSSAALLLLLPGHHVQRRRRDL